MSKLDPLAATALLRAKEKAEPLLAAALARHGVSSPDQLPQELAQQIYQDTMLQVAAQNFPQARLDVLKHGLTAFRHPHFSPAFARIKAQIAASSDAFEPAAGIDAAVVLAGLGLCVAPFDRKQPRILADPSNDIDEVAAMFSRWKSAYVGYSPCDAPFYILCTDCVRTMASQIATRPELHEVSEVLRRTGSQLPTGPFLDFKHGIGLIAREPGDTISTVFLNNPNPHEGSVLFYAGWSANGIREGAPNGGFLPVPMQFLDAAPQDASTAMWIWKPVGVRTTFS